MSSLQPWLNPAPASGVVARASALAPFRIRSFRFQWPADLATSWAFEMEVLILGWYVLIETGSVQLLVLFGALQYVGALLSPVFGVAGDRIGYRRLLYWTRALYAVQAALIGLLAALHLLTPAYVLVIAAAAGLIRPSDLMLRNALIAQTMPPPQLLGALGLSRSTSDSARIAGALAGAGAVAAFGMVHAYVIVTLFYLAGFALSLGVAGRVAQVAPAASAPAAAPQAVGAAPPAAPGAAPPPAPVLVTAWRDLRSAFHYVWHTPALLGALTLAFLVNLLAFPFFNGLLPYVAKHIYGTGPAGLGTLVASFASGGLLGSILLGTNRLPLRAARTALIAGAAWFIAIFWFAQVTHLATGMALLVCAGIAQNFCLTPIAAVMLRESAPAYRGRVMGMRILAIWGLPAGLLLSGPLIERAGFAATGVLYSVIGLAGTAAIALRWRAHLWRAGAPGNARA